MISQAYACTRDAACFPITQGVFIAVAGPSGSGKDSILSYAREHLGPLQGRVVFARRVITRPEKPDAEEHDSLSQAQFEKEKAAGHFAISWRANRLHYGLRSELDDEMRAGRVVVANVSRAAIPEIQKRYAQVFPVMVTAPRELLAERLSLRGRETKEEVGARLDRGERGELSVPDALVIDNSGPLTVAGERFLQILNKAAAATGSRV